MLAETQGVRSSSRLLLGDLCRCRLTRQPRDRIHLAVASTYGTEGVGSVLLANPLNLCTPHVAREQGRSDKIFIQPRTFRGTFPIQPSASL